MEFVNLLKHAQALQLDLGNVVAVGQQHMTIDGFDIGHQEVVHTQRFQQDILFAALGMDIDIVRVVNYCQQVGNLTEKFRIVAMRMFFQFIEILGQWHVAGADFGKVIEDTQHARAKRNIRTLRTVVSGKPVPSKLRN